MNHFSISFCFGIRVVFPDLKSIKLQLNRLLGVRNDPSVTPIPDA